MSKTPKNSADVEDPKAADLVRKSARPTIRDVAAAAGVSLATVSNVMNGNESAVGAKTRRRVTREIEKLGYRPQASGRGLRTSRRHSFAMVIIDESEAYLADAFASNMVPGFTDALNRRGYSAVLHGCKLKDFDKTVVVRHLQVDGYCIFASGDASARKSLIKKLSDLNQPIVMVQETLDTVPEDFAIVRQDDYSGGLQLADHLMARDVRKILVLAPMLEWPAIEARIAGLRAGITQANKTAEVTIVNTRSEGLVDAMAGLRSHLETNPMPDAIAAANDHIGIAALRLLREMGMNVPADVLVTGFNDFAFRDYATPLLTTVSSPARDLGMAAAEALIARVEEGSFPQRETLLSVQLKLGEST